MLILAVESLPGLTPLSAGTSLVVALLAVVMTVMALRAAKRRRNPGLRIVGLAFLVFALKNVFSAFNVWTHFVPHDAIELVLSLFDLGLILLLFIPFLMRRRG